MLKPKDQRNCAAKQKQAAKKNKCQEKDLIARKKKIILKAEEES